MLSSEFLSRTEDAIIHVGIVALAVFAVLVF